MRKIERILYTANELNDSLPKSFKRAYNEFLKKESVEDIVEMVSLTIRECFYFLDINLYEFHIDVKKADDSYVGYTHNHNNIGNKNLPQYLKEEYPCIISSDILFGSHVDLFMQPFRELIEKDSLNGCMDDLINLGCDNLFENLKIEINERLSEVSFISQANANNWEFYEDGTRFFELK